MKKNIMTSVLYTASAVDVAAASPSQPSTVRARSCGSITRSSGWTSVIDSATTVCWTSPAGWWRRAW